MHSLAASNLGTTQSTGTIDSYSLSAGHNGARNCLFHRPAVRNTAFNLVSNCPGYQISIKLRLLNFLNIELYLLVNKGLEVKPQFINSLSSSPDDHTGSGSVDSYRHLI